MEGIDINSRNPILESDLGGVAITVLGVGALAGAVAFMLSLASPVIENTVESFPVTMVTSAEVGGAAGDAIL